MRILTVIASFCLYILYNLDFAERCDQVSEGYSIKTRTTYFCGNIYFAAGTAETMTVLM